MLRLGSRSGVKIEVLYRVGLSEGMTILGFGLRVVNGLEDIIGSGNGLRKTKSGTR